MSREQKGYARHWREAFEAWQVKSDEFCQQWMSHPAFLYSGRMALECGLDLYTSANAALKVTGCDTERPTRAMKEVSSAAASHFFQATVRTFELARGERLMPQVAATPCDVVYTENKLRLLRYRSERKSVYPVPLLIVGSLVNKHYILDLTPGRSYVEHLLNEGFDVYMIDWGVPGDADTELAIEDYVCGYLPNIVREVLKHSKAEQLSLLGYSMGGILSLIYTALDGRRVKNLVPLATPVDFKEAGVLGAWTDRRYFDVDRFVDTFGNVPAEMIHCSFRMLKPASNLTRPINLLQHVDDTEELKVLLALERWLIDSAPIPGEFYRQLVKALYQQNLLAQDALKIGGRTVKLSNISCSVLNVIGAHDQTVPPDSSRPLLNLISSLDKEELLLPYGHATLSIGSGAREDFWFRSAEWLKKRSGVGEKNGHRRMNRSRTARLKEQVISDE